jgi:hypothetical protein
MADDRTVHEPARDISLVGEYDVVVVGGGSAGVMAAIGAARAGGTVCLIERFASVGGAINMGLMGHFGNRFVTEDGRPIVGGAPLELFDRVIADGATPYANRQEAFAAGHSMFYRHEHAGHICLQMLQEAGVELWLLARFSTALRVGDRRAHATGGGIDVIFEAQSGRYAVRARQVVDCTGGADVAEALGALMETGGHKSWGLLFEMGRVDLDRYEAFLDTLSDEDPEWNAWLANYLGMTAEELAQDLYWSEWLDGKRRAWPFRPLLRQAVEAGDLDLIRDLPGGGQIRYGWDGFWPEPWHGPDDVTANVCMVTGLDPTDPRNVTKAEVAARTYAFEFLAFLRKYMPGFEQAAIRTMAAQTMFRGGREIVGETSMDERKGEPLDQREDVVCLAGGQHAVGLPLGMFAPKGIPNVLVAGKCAADGYRVRASVTCMAAGYSCGILAAMAARQGVTPMALDPAARRAELQKHGVLLTPGELPEKPYHMIWEKRPGVPSFDAEDGAKRAKKLS